MPSDHSAEELRRIYERRFAARTGYRDRVWQILTDYLSRYIPASSAVLDLGCGYGEFVNNVTATRRIAMDLNPTVAELADEGVEVLLHDCSERWPLDDATLDVVFSSNFFEHLASKSDLRRTIEEAFRCTRPGGRLVALGPNARLVGGAYWDFYDHHIALTERSLVELLRDCGYEIEDVVPAFLPYTMSEGRERPLWLLRLYLRLPLVWRVLGRQFLVVARRPVGRT
ncbi:MAG TPA: class I SAM-dependent methyltransferase [Acidimicrobiales bacterium]|nr:class I SAM-dependent methyltransferase [Acidimicrobiales bacterium]